MARFRKLLCSIIILLFCSSPVFASLRVCDAVPTPNPREPHPLRPNPGIDCTPDIEQKARVTCGTDLVAVKKVSLPRCEGDSEPGKTVQCQQDVTVNDIPISIGLSDLELPIAGVASNLAISDSIQDSQKMTQYTSWYQEGANGQANQEPTPSPMGTSDPLLFAGPIKKLIDTRILDQRREDLIRAAASDTSYNEIIGYVKDNKVIGRIAARDFYTQEPLRTDIKKIRLTDMLDHIRPPYIDGDIEAVKWYTLWQQTPFVQTVDIPGEVFATLSPADPDVRNAKLAIVSTLSDLRIHFPHLVENDQLSQLLQSVFRSPGQPETSGFAEYRDVDYSTVNRKPPFTTSNNCNLEVTFWNPGDNLAAQQTIHGNFSFTKTVKYSYRELTGAERADFLAQGLPIPTTVGAEVSAPVSIFARNPLEMDRIYDRLVDGPSSVYKAISPLGEYILDYPAAAALSLDCGPNCEVWPGNQKGRKAELFFPHWGRILKIFHEKLQSILDPRSRGGTGSSNASTLGTQYLMDHFKADLLSQTVIPSQDAINRIIAKIKAFQGQPGNTWIGSKFEQNYQKIIDFATQHGFNPTLLLALYLEESHGEAAGTYPLGCGNATTLDGSLQCFATDPAIQSYRHAPLWEFMCRYSDGHYPCDYSAHPNFVRNVFDFYNQLTP